MMSSTLTSERFRRLARSSPYLWQTIEFRWLLEGDETRHAWIRRPGSLRVENGDGSVRTSVADRPFPGAKVNNGRGWESMPGRWPSQVEPVYASDGLVASIPYEIDVDYSAPFLDNYHWVAMLNPLELADPVHNDDASSTVPVELSDLLEVEHHGRAAWQAVATPTTAYDPRCDCCSLLGGEVDHELREWTPSGSSVVRLDARTGVCVWIEGESTTSLDVEILAVDHPLDDELFAPVPRRWLRRNRG